MEDIKIIETRTKKVLKYKNQIFKFISTSNTQDQHTVWECAVDKCTAFVHLSNDRNKILKSNETHDHSSSGPARRTQKTTSTSSQSSSSNVSRSNSLDSNPASTEHDIANSSTATVIHVASTNSTKEIKEVKLNPDNSTNFNTDNSELIDNSELKFNNESIVPIISTPSLDYSNLLPDNHSIVSMNTPTNMTNFISNLTTNSTKSSTFNETPQIHNDITKDTTFQIHSLIQEIINKQIIINNLNEQIEKDNQQLDTMKRKNEHDETELNKLRYKSDEDDKIIKDMIETIRLLEGLKSKNNLNQSDASNNNKKIQKEKNKQISSIQKDNNKQTSSIEHRESEISKTRVTSSQNMTRLLQKPSTSKLPSTVPKTPCNLVVFGDSHVRNLRVHLERELPGSYKIFTHFKPGGTLQEIANSMIDDKMTYEKIFVMAGTNDVCFSNWTEVENAIVKISQAHKDKKIFLILVPPRGEKSIMNKYIKIFNRNIKILANRLNNIQCIEIGYFLNHRDFCHDKLHLNRYGQIKLCKKIKHHVMNNNFVNLKHEYNKYTHCNTSQSYSGHFNQSTYSHTDPRYMHKHNQTNYKKRYQYDTYFIYSPRHSSYKNAAMQNTGTNMQYNIPVYNKYSTLEKGINFQNLQTTSN